MPHPESNGAVNRGAPLQDDIGKGPTVGTIDATRDLQGRRVGRYQVLAGLGHGTVGVVYKARDPQLDRTVALKTPRTDLGPPPAQRAESKKDFIREAKTAGRLDHPKIVRIYDVMEIQETPYIIMEYIEGQTLADLMAAAQPLPYLLVIQVALQVCSALNYAHAQGVLHGDIKPTNILIGTDGEVKVTDFGMARLAEHEFTQIAVVGGAPACISPEQLRGRELDGRADVFALGVVLYEALGGAQAFPGGDTREVLQKILHEEPAPLQERNPSVPPALAAAIHRALAKEPAERYPDARLFAEALRQALESAGGGTPIWDEAAVFVEPQLEVTRRRGVGIAVGAVVVALAVGAGLWARWAGDGGGRPHPATPGGIPAGLVPDTPTSEAVGGSAAGGRLEEEPASLQAAGAESLEKTAQPAEQGARGPAVVPQEPGRTRPGLPSQEPVPRPGAIRHAEDTANGLPEEPQGRPAVLVPSAPAPGDRAGTPPGTSPVPRVRSGPEATGCLSVNAVPFARVFVDGKYAGETPKGCVRISAGERRVHFEKDGERSPERIVRVTEEHTADNPFSLSYDFRVRRYLDR